MLRNFVAVECILILSAFQCHCQSSPLPSSPPVYLLGYSVVNEGARQTTFFSVAHHLYVPAGEKVKFRFFGNFTANTYAKLSLDMDCKKGSTKEKKVLLLGSYETAEVDMTFPIATKDDYTSIYFCLREGSSVTSDLQGKYLGSDGKPRVHAWLTLKIIKRKQYTVYIRVLAIVILLLLSALFSGLNLGLLSLDKTDLKVIINTGSQKERSEALKIVPVRNHGNFLLCSLLFSNVLVNTVLTLVMDSLFGGGDWQTVVVTTLAIVIIGEILPQAICSRYGLTVGAKTICITKLFMTITFPVSYPMGKILDKLLGEEIGAVYTRDRLKELLKVTRDQHGLEKEEMGIISGTLDMKTKTVKDVMTPLDNMYMVPYDASLNVDLLVHIEDSGFTRIPVYQGERWNVVGVLNVKNLTLYDPGQSIPIRNHIEQEKAHLFFVFENTRLDYMLKAFREGSRGHMAFVQRINEDGPGDPKYETIGLVTLEDVLEEILQAEIYDENDVEKLQAKSEEKDIPLPIVHYAKTNSKRSSSIVSKRGTH